MTDSNEPQESRTDHRIAGELATLRSHVTTLVGATGRIEEALKANAAAHTNHEAQDRREIDRLEQAQRDHSASIRRDTDRIEVDLRAIKVENVEQEKRIRVQENNFSKILGAAIAVSTIITIGAELLRHSGH